MLPKNKLLPPTAVPLAIAEDNHQLINLWLYGKSPHSQKAYRQDIYSFLAFIECKRLQEVTLNDVQAYAKALAAQGYSLSSQRRKLSSLKSLISYGHKLGLLAANVSAPVPIPKPKNTLAQRILTEEQVLSMIALEPIERNRLLMRFMYATGARVSEVCALKWEDLKETPQGYGQVMLWGKGSETRAVVFSAETWRLLKALRCGAKQSAPVFRSREGGGHLDQSQVNRIIAAAGIRAGIEGKVSPHWLRHSHASHALNRGTPIHLVQATLGHSSLATTGQYLHVNPQDSSGLHLPI